MTWNITAKDALSPKQCDIHLPRRRATLYITCYIPQKLFCNQNYIISTYLVLPGMSQTVIIGVTLYAICTFSYVLYHTMVLNNTLNNVIYSPLCYSTVLSYNTTCFEHLLYNTYTQYLT